VSDGVAHRNIARREQQIVALALRGIPFYEIGRQLGITRQGAHRAFNKALRRGTDSDLQTHHRVELAKLAQAETNIWRTMDANRDDARIQFEGTTQLHGLALRRAKLLGLDAPTRMDVTGIYRRGGDEVTAEQRAREAVIQALPVEEQRRIFGLFYEAGKRAAAGDFSQPAIETTVSNGLDNRNGVADSDGEPET
jgi:hypothetical protein